MDNLIKCDIAVIGGGPAGMMAAGRAAELGARVVLLEKNGKLGVKLLITGGGRCNLTNKNITNGNLTELYGKNGKFLHAAVNSFSSNDLINFFEQRKVKTKEEEGGKIFPTADKASAINDALIGYLNKSKVKILKNTAVKSLTLAENKAKIKSIKALDKEIFADRIIISTGGKSYPATGSTGDGFILAEKLGHSIIPPTASLTPLVTSELWVKKLQGVSLKNILLSAYSPANNKKQAEEFGEIIFTHEGISGPAIFNLTRKIGGQKFPFKLRLDFFPNKAFEILDQEVQNILQKNGKKNIKNILSEIAQQKLAALILDLVKANPDKKSCDITKDERKKIVHTLKELTLNIRKAGGFEKAIITKGGINLKEINPNSMQSKIIENLYFAGEVIDIDGPTGGYNLQAAWSTGYLAGTSAATK